MNMVITFMNSETFFKHLKKEEGFVPEPNIYIYICMYVVLRYMYECCAKEKRKLLFFAKKTKKNLSSLTHIIFQV